MTSLVSHFANKFGGPANLRDRSKISKTGRGIFVLAIALPICSVSIKPAIHFAT